VSIDFAKSQWVILSAGWAF